MNELPLSVGILAWHSGQVLVNTLKTYFDSKFLQKVNDTTILFQEFNEEDKRIAKHFGIRYIGLQDNIGIGNAFVKLAEKAQSENILLLEHDWKLAENERETYIQLSNGIRLLEEGYDCVRYRHREKPGHPHFSFRHRGRELDYYDSEIEAKSPHLLDSVHWLDPAERFPDKIQRDGEFFVTTSKWGNWTNNPCMYKKKFYIEKVSPFTGDGIDLEGNISKWWNRQGFKVAHHQTGLFTHIDEKKHGR